MGEGEGPFSVHLLGLRKTGTPVIERYLRNPPEGSFEDLRTRFTALAVDIGEGISRPSARPRQAYRESSESANMPASNG